MKKKYKNSDCIDKLLLALEKYPTFMCVGDIQKELGFDELRLNQLAYDGRFPHPVYYKKRVKHWKTSDIQDYLLKLQHSWRKHLLGYIIV